ncbi:porin [Amphibiibacter pelophylacis]|uniref:Porin n=1 Tax=Amphibiibacter pelophylacis TaxID=1799477 RepID=A0ACC6P247_9BURK
MKKTSLALIAASGLIASLPAVAQSSVTLYGQASIGIAQGKTKTVINGVTTETTNRGVMNSNYSGSILGFKGTEDLGGGLKANFVVEGNVSMDGGASFAFDRVTMVGLSGSWGALNIGRQYSLVHNILCGADLDCFSNWSTTVHWFVPTYLPGTVNWRNQFGPIDIGLQASKGRGTTNGVTKPTKAGGALLRYVSGSSFIGAAYNYAEGNFDNRKGINLSAGAAGTPAADQFIVDKGQGYTVAGSYDFGVAQTYANYVDSKGYPDRDVDSYARHQQLNLGVAVPVGAVTLGVGYGRNQGEFVTGGVRTVGSHYTGNNYYAGAVYNFNKGTRLTVRAGVNNDRKADSGNSTRSTLVGVDFAHRF